MVAVNMRGVGYSLNHQSTRIHRLSKGLGHIVVGRIAEAAASSLLGRVRNQKKSRCRKEGNESGRGKWAGDYPWRCVKNPVGLNCHRRSVVKDYSTLTKPTGNFVHISNDWLLLLPLNAVAVDGALHCRDE